MDIKSDGHQIEDYELPADAGIGSAYDLWGPNGSSNRNSLLTYIENNESSWMGVNFFTFVHSYDGALDTILKELDGTILDQFLPDDSLPNGLEVIFPDTSRVIVDVVILKETPWDYFSSVAALSVRSGSSVDADGNVIPETDTEAEGETWGFDATNGFDTVGNWKSLLEYYGFNIYGVYGESGKYSCTGSCDLNGDCTVTCIAN
jgi:hypothetical protein